MKIEFVELQNFRKLKSCRIDFSAHQTIFVGANNSGKTSAMDALMAFLKKGSSFSTRDFTLSNWRHINEIGRGWITAQDETKADLSIASWEPYLPQLDVWLSVADSEIHYINHLIPTLDWESGLLGVRLRFEPKNIEVLYKEFKQKYIAAQNAKSSLPPKTKNKTALDLWPKSMWDFLERGLDNFFDVRSYILDPIKLTSPNEGIAEPQKLPENSLPLEKFAFNGLIKVDIINAQRGFYDANSEGAGAKVGGSLTTQLKTYYSKHLDPETEPQPDDIAALESIEIARKSFDDKLNQSFKGSLGELASLNYPGFGNPNIQLSSRISAIDGLSHSAAVQFEVLTPTPGGTNDFPLSLPEKYNGLGYQNLISMVFKLIRFRDEWMKVGKSQTQIINTDDDPGFEPLHLVLVEEPEAHLHAQVQQVFIRKAYEVLRNHPELRATKKFQTQLVVSTHSNHIAHEVDFTSLRYFRRATFEPDKITTSTVVNLSTTFGSNDDTTKFATRYLRTTHCDLFFADAAVLIEGPAERMLLPHFIKHHYKDLNTCYISILEIGGSHAHRLRPLLEELGIITLIITDIDSVDPSKNGSSVRPERNKGYATGNSTLRTWLPNEDTLDKLIDMSANDKVSQHFPIRVAYQVPINIEKSEAVPYTFEDALALDNLDLFKNIKGNGLIKKIQKAATNKELADIAAEMYKALTTDNVKKAEFALELLFSTEPSDLRPPSYIAEGLDWIHDKLKSKKIGFPTQKLQP